MAFTLAAKLSYSLRIWNSKKVNYSNGNSPYPIAPAGPSTAKEALG